MIPMTLPTADLEQIYDALAEAIDATPEDKRLVMLGKLALTLASLLGDRDKVLEAIAIAARDL